ncbi:TonB-dependent receptor [Kordiimonas aestuarii]|uniref:TonB-dependent receptor n=1 Tax=Kordiimonas aestuarii TaxID=1005925 RepID=UPI0021D16E1A|nr:TonB-dependent receptor [Kordiimonas aestuarii]
MNARNLRKYALILGMGVSCAALSTGGAMAANSDGSISGLVASEANTALSGATITVLNEENGYRRSVTADNAGKFRFARLPVGTYRVTVSKDGYERAVLEDVRVSIGGTTDLNVAMSLGDMAMEEIIVSAGAVSGINMTTTESAFNISANALEDLPIVRSADAVALLAPGVVQGPAFGGISFGGASVGENSIFVNGLNVSDVETGVGFSDVPFAMFKEFQVKTGGYSVEFGRTTGGVVNAVLKSGTNEFHGGGEVFWEPQALRGNAQDFYNRDNDKTIYRSDDVENNFKANVHLSGPIIKDKVFFYALFQPRLNNGEFYNTTGSSFSDYKDNTGFWGGKVDWFITDNHSIEGFVFSDKSKEVTDRFQDGTYAETATSERGGTNWALTYTGQFTDNFTVKALYGNNKRNSDDYTNISTECNRVYDDRDGVDEHIGCTTQLRNDNRINSREAMRLDMEWQLDRHLLRFGFDHEKRTTFMERASVGPEQANFTIDDTQPGDSVNDTTVPDGVFAYVLARQEIRGGTFDANTSAAYLEDIWSVTDELTATLGVRWDRFDSKDAEGNSFIKVSNMFSPRFGLAWDVKGEGSMKLYANAGRYYFPIANGLAAREGGGTIDTRTYYALQGLQENETSSGLTNITPILGQQIGQVVQFGSGEGRDDKAFVVDHDLEASYQDEFILGFEMQVNDSWDFGVRGIYREFHDAIEDMRIDVDVAGCGNISKWVFGNVGRELTIDHDCDTGGVQTVTVDLGEAQSFGYDLDGDGNPDPIGSDRPIRKYRALEFVANRHWDDTWMARLSYTLSKSTGNYEGGVNSDTGNDIPGWTESGDDVMFINSNYGMLANDHRHQFKAYGAYAITPDLTMGANFSMISGAPINARAYGNPFNTQTRKEGNYLCVDNCLDPGDGIWTSQDRVFEYIERGQYGRTPWQVRLDLSLDYTTEFNGFEVYAGLDVFNVLNTQKAYRLYEIITDSFDGPNEDFLAVRTAAQPRAVRLNVGFKF